jgi:glycosyltransferase involved in cell wall biosynthesis
MTPENGLPYISVVMPMYNQENHIRHSLESILNQDYPADNYEIIIIDNSSEDKSAEIVMDIQKNNKIIKYFNQPERSITKAINSGIKNSKGEILVRLDAHTEAPRNYISKIADTLINNKAELVSGIIVPIGTNYWSKTIGLCLSSSFGIGDSRLYHYDEPVYTKRGYLGAYRKDYIVKLGYYDELLFSADDYDVFYRVKKAGGRILVLPELGVKYYCRESLKKVFGQYFKYGWTKVVVFKKYGKLLSARAIVPGLFLVTLIVFLSVSIFIKESGYIFLLLVGIYLITNLIFSATLSFRKGFKFLFSAPVVFITLHTSHALGFCYGLLFKKY